MSAHNRSYTLDEADQMIMKDTKVSHHSLQEWILIMIKAIQEKGEGDIQEIMNMIFLIYKDIIPSEYLGMVFQQVEGGVYSEEVEDTLDDSSFSKYVTVDESGPGLNMGLTHRGDKYVGSSLTEEDQPLMEQISSKLLTWKREIENGRFTHYVDEKFREYSDEDPRAKIKRRVLRADTSLATLEVANAETIKDFWQWLCSLPKPENPAINNNGTKDVLANHLRGTNVDFFYLSFRLGGSKERICTIPHGIKVLIPSLAVIASEAEKPGSTVTDLRRFIDTDHENIIYRRIEIDGESILGLERFRVYTHPFEVVFPEKAIFNARAGTSMAIADGVYVVWVPPEGEHVIHFEGKIGVSEEADSLRANEYEEDVRYVLKVS